MNNPYSGVSFNQPVLATELRRPNSNERIVGNNGEINADDNADLVVQIANMMKAAETNHVVTESAALQAQKLRKTHADMVTAAFRDPSALSNVGKTLAEEIYITSNRQGFMRRFLKQENVTQGQVPHVRMQMKNVVASIASSASEVETKLIRDNDYYPPEFYISARPFIEQREINRNTGDILEAKYLEALEAIMVAEDRQWLALVNQTVGLDNGLTNMVGTVNPLTLGTFQTEVDRWGIPAANWLIANDIWSDIVGDTGFQRLLDPVSRHELVMEGRLGTILGMDVITDQFRHPEHKVLSQGEMYIVGSEDLHGQYTDRGGIDSAPIDGTQEKVPGRGWWMSETMSMVITNSRSVAKGIRV
jgi:hypothetical protein